MKKVRKVLNIILLLLVLLLFSKSMSYAAIYQSCQPSVPCTLSCSRYEQYYFAKQGVVYASCTGNSDNTCTFARTNYVQNTYDISCPGTSGDNGCTPGTCSCPADSITDAMCRAANNNDPNVYASNPEGSGRCRVNDTPCSGTDNCGNCTGTAPCYRDETNTTPPSDIPIPEYVTVGIGDPFVWYPLSPNPATPTKIPAVPTGTNPKVWAFVPKYPPSCPTSSGGCGAYFAGTHFPTGWQISTNSNGIDTQSFTTFKEKLKQPGTTGNIQGKYYLKNTCNDNKVVSTNIRTGYYRICNPNCPTPLCRVTDAHCGAGFTVTNTGSKCVAHKATCSQTTDCGNSKVCNEAQCYKVEPNQTPPPPTDPTMTVDGFTFPLSVTEYTRIKKPLPSQPDNAVTFSVTAPTGTYKNPTFNYNCENYGLNDEWKENDGWNNCNGLEGEDQCLVNTTADTIIYKGVSKTPVEVLKEGARGIIATRYRSQNTCNDDYKYSSHIFPRYQVDRLPVVDTVTISGTPSEVNGCRAVAYTGSIANRTLTITVKGTDADGVNDINGLSLWLVRRGVGDLSNDINKILAVGPGSTQTSSEEIGIFLGDYDRDPTKGLALYKAINPDNTLLGWGRDAPSANQPGTAQLQDKNGNILIEEVTATRRTIGINKEYTVTLVFPESESTPISGTYDIYAGFSDIFTYSAKPTGGTYLDSQNVKATTQSWSFDFVKPTITDPQVDIQDAQNIRLSWTSSDNLTNGIRSDHTVVNVYKTGQNTHPVRRTSPTAPTTTSPDEILPGDPTNTDGLGVLSPLTNGWIHPTSGTTEMRANVLDNSEGDLYFYITTYDLACNYAQTGEDGTSQPDPVNLDRWIATKGGIFYSKGSVNYPTKTVTGETYNLGTELLSTSSSSIEKALDYTSTPESRPAIAKTITDINNQRGLFDALKANFENIRGSLTPISPQGDALTCTDPKGCIWVTKDMSTDITYSGSIIVVPPEGTKDITIKADLKQDTNKDALFVFSDGRIEIGGTAKTNPSHIHTDTIDAFLLAKEDIHIMPEALSGDLHDRIKVNGGVVAFGDDIIAMTPAFYLRRTLGLHNPLNPVLNITYHPKYAVASELFFGLQVNAYKREVGFKPM